MTKPTMVVRTILTFLFSARIAAAFPDNALAQKPTAPPAAAEPATRPILRIEAGMHTAPIIRIGVDRAGRYLVTGSSDKTARIWSLTDGVLVRTLRPPIGDGNEGRIDSVAISPDGDTVACAGYTGQQWDHSTSIYLFSRESGTMIRRIPDLPDVIDDLSFSPDGRYLSAGLITGGVRVFSAANGTLVMADKAYQDRCNSTDWDGGDRLVTSSYDGNIRTYNVAPELKLIRKSKAPRSSRPHTVRFSPDGTKIAVGYADTSAVSVLSSADLDTFCSPDVTGITGTSNLSKVCWSSDGKTLYAGGSAQNRSRQRFIRGWADFGRGAYGDLAVAQNTISDLRTLSPSGASGGELVYASLDPAWGVVDGVNYALSLGKTTAIADYRNNVNGFQLSQDGSSITFSYASYGQIPAQVSIRGTGVELRSDASVSHFIIQGDLAAPTVTAEGLAVADWNNTTHPTLNGKPLALRKYEISHRLAIAADRQSFVLGTSFGLICFDAKGVKKWDAAAIGEAWGVNVAGNGKVCAAAFGDGTIRWYRMSDGAELLDFFPHADEKRWILWTPDGYYTCSPGGDDLLGWHVNRGKRQAADFYPASRFRGRYYRPDVIGRVLTTLDDAEALRLANAAAGHSHETQPPTEFQPPATVTPLSPGTQRDPAVGRR